MEVLACIPKLPCPAGFVAAAVSEPSRRADVDAVVAEFFQRYFGPAADPMRRFYLGLEAIACDPANYPPPYLRASGIDWKKVAWEKLGTPERMRELGALIHEAEAKAGAGLERQRVELWRAALWDWMEAGSKAATASASPR